MSCLSGKKSATGGDVFMMCSDGLSDTVSTDAMADIMQKHPAPKEAVRALVAAALDAGGHDNVTVSIVRVEAGSAKKPRKPKTTAHS